MGSNALRRGRKRGPSPADASPRGAVDRAVELSHGRAAPPGRGWDAAIYRESHADFMLTQDIAKALGARLDGDGTLEIKRLVHPAQAKGPADLALATNPAVAAALNGTAAQAVVVAEKNKAP